MLALRLNQWKTLPTFEDVPVPEPGPGEVLLRMAAAGVCHSDLHLIHHWDEKSMPGMKPPFTIGHENAGFVEKLGSGTQGLEPGQAVVVFPAHGCGHCEYCRTDNEVYCLSSVGQAPGLGADGGMAEYLLVKSARHCIPIGDLDTAVAAPMTDAGMSSYHAVKKALPKLHPGTTAMVIGIGGLGHMALQFLHVLTGARIIAADKNKAALDLATQLGADHTLLPGEHAKKEIAELTRGRMVDVVFDFAGVQATLDLARRAVRPLGEIHVVGLGGGEYRWQAGRFPWEVPIYSHLGGTHQDLREVVALLKQGKVKAEATSYPLKEALRVLDKLAKGEVRGRAVMTP